MTHEKIAYLKRANNILDQIYHNPDYVFNTKGQIIGKYTDTSRRKRRVFCMAESSPDQLERMWWVQPL